MASVCFVTAHLFPVQSLADWALEVWARAKAHASAGDTVTILWHLPKAEEAGLKVPRTIYRELGIELVATPELAPFLAADEVFGREPGLRLLPALRKLHAARKFDRIELPVGDGISLRVLQAAMAGAEFDGARIVFRLGKFGEWNRWRRRRLALSKEEIKRDFMERETVELGADVRCSSSEITAFAKEIGWDVSRVTPEELPVFDGVAEAGVAPAHPCYMGTVEEELEGLLRHLPVGGSIRRWLCAFTERLGDEAREQIKKVVRPGRSEVEVLMPRRCDAFPQALREKGAIVVHGSGVDDARLRWLAAEKVAFVFVSETARDIPALEKFPELGYQADVPGSLITALEAARNFQRWPEFFSSLAGKPGRSEVELPDRPVRKAEPARVLMTVSHYNLGGLMSETLEALAAQEYPACEVLVVDDGSTDAAALDAFRAMKADFPAFHFVELPHVGYWSPRNHAIRECSAPYVIIVDGDNLPVPRMAARFVEAMERNAGHAAFSSYVSAFRETRETALAGEFQGTHTPIGGDIVSGHFENVYGDTNSIFRVEAIRTIGGFRENFRCSFGDWEIFHRLVGEGFRLGVVPEVLLHYRRRGGGMIRQSPLFTSYFEMFRVFTPGCKLRLADQRRLNHALHGLALGN
jgi:GT2 family glycosyltransferase